MLRTYLVRTFCFSFEIFFSISEQILISGWSGARLAQLVQEAALVAVRKQHNSVLQSDMDEAVDRLTVGPKRPGVDLGYQGQCRRATTEVGVAITSHLLRRYENANVEYCERISIVPRGQVFVQLPSLYIILNYLLESFCQSFLCLCLKNSQYIFGN
jgi:hypothetical protein